MTLHALFGQRFVSVAAIAVGLVFLACGLGGCHTSEWKASYAIATAAPALSAGDSVDVRQITWTRMQSTKQEMADMANATNTHPDEWDDARRLEAKTKLLQGLQVSEAPTSVTVLGESRFITTDAARPDTEQGRGRIVTFAREVGANLVVWSACSRGMADRIQPTPVTSYTTGTDRFPDATDGRRRYSTYTETTTTWVPVRVTEEQFEYIAFFIRR